MHVIKNQFPKAEDRQPLWSLGLGITVWFIDLNVVYALASVACKWGWFPFTIAGIPGLLVVEGAVTLLSLLAVLYLVYRSWRAWRIYQAQKPQNNPDVVTVTENDRRPLMAFIAMLLNGFFFLFLIASFVPLAALNACALG